VNGPLHIAPARPPARCTCRRSVGMSFCADCGPGGRLCPDHAEDQAAAGVYEAAYMRVAGIGSDGGVLALTGGLT
jgi:hypothetical protein